MSDRNNEINNDTNNEVTKTYVEEVDSSASEQMAEPKLSAIAVIGAVIFSPTEAFKSLRQKPRVLLAIFLIPLLPVLYYLLCWDSYQFILIEQMQKSTQGTPIDPELMKTILIGLRISTPIMTYVFYTPMLLLPALIYFLIGKVTKAELTFKHAFSAILHASVISSLVWVFHILMSQVFGQSNVMASMSSLASLLPADTVGSPLGTLAATIDIFSIWYLFVLYLALIYTCNYTKKVSAITVIGTYIVSTGFSVGAVVVATMMGGL